MPRITREQEYAIYRMADAYAIDSAWNIAININRGLKWDKNANGHYWKTRAANDARTVRNHIKAALPNDHKKTIDTFHRMLKIHIKSVKENNIL